jgi:hypothetical protein
MRMIIEYNAHFMLNTQYSLKNRIIMFNFCDWVDYVSIFNEKNNNELVA